MTVKQRIRVSRPRRAEDVLVSYVPPARVTHWNVRLSSVGERPHVGRAPHNNTPASLTVEEWD